MKKLAVIGAGDLGKLVAYHAMADKHYDAVVFFDDFAAPGTSIANITILGKLDQINNCFDKKMFDELFVGIGYKHMAFRKQIFDNFKNKIPFGKVIHSSSYIDRSCIISRGCFVLPGCILDANVFLNENTVLNTGCVIAHDSSIGSHTFLSPAVAVAGFVKIGECCNIGINTTIIDNVSIAANSQTGGGTVVIKNIDKSGLYVGNPARFIR